jgi:hypothetical protein
MEFTSMPTAEERGTMDADQRVEQEAVTICIRCSLDPQKRTPANNERILFSMVLPSVPHVSKQFKEIYT